MILLQSVYRLNDFARPQSFQWQHGDANSPMSQLHWGGPYETSNTKPGTRWVLNWCSPRWWCSPRFLLHKQRFYESQEYFPIIFLFPGPALVPAHQVSHTCLLNEWDPELRKAWLLPSRVPNLTEEPDVPKRLTLQSLGQDLYSWRPAGLLPGTSQRGEKGRQNTEHKNTTTCECTEQSIKPSMWLD